MKPILLVGIVLVVIGAVSLVYQGITYTTREKVLQIGSRSHQKDGEDDYRCHLSWAEPRLQLGSC